MDEGRVAEGDLKTEGFETIGRDGQDGFEGFGGQGNFQEVRQDVEQYDYDEPPDDDEDVEVDIEGFEAGTADQNYHQQGCQDPWQGEHKDERMVAEGDMKVEGYGTPGQDGQGDFQIPHQEAEQIDYGDESADLELEVDEMDMVEGWLSGSEEKPPGK